MTQIWCCHNKFLDQTEGYGQTGKEGQVTILDLPKAHVLPYMTIALTFRQSLWSSLGLPSESAVSLDIRLSIYGIFRLVCPIQIFSKTTNSLQTMGMDGNFHPPSSQKCMAGEYHSHGLEYSLGPYVVNKLVFLQGAK